MNTTTNEKAATHNWSPPFHGVQHLHLNGDKRSRYWCSVTAYRTFTNLTLPGCAFSPESRDFDTVEEARAAGERWLSQLAEEGRK